ncbi:dehydrogenase E1 component subunit alpha/beta [soil metagenome]
MWQTRRCLESDYPTVELLSLTGDLASSDLEFPEELTAEMYRLMVLAREFDRKMLSLQRQGRIGTYPMLEGQEAVQIGSALALAENDFVFPSYREHGVQLARGVPIEVVMSYWRGLPNEDWDVLKYRMGITTVPIASQLPHAVGYSYVTKLRGESGVAVTYFGDGATSEVDFHSGMNFAGVWKTPTVFICANNLYAISVPYAKQTASPTIAQKADAYGMPGVRVDGMDVLAMYQVTKEALDRARRGDGPTLIEAMTYRYGAHATADDARRYRSAEEETSWRERDPIDRFRRFLEKQGRWDEQVGEKVAMEVADQVEAAITDIEARSLPSRDDTIRHAYQRIPPSLIEQLYRAQDANKETRTEFRPDEIWQRETETEPGGPTESMTMADAINAALREALEADNQAIILGEDVGISGGVFRITDSLQESFGEDRVIDTPLNESGIVGTAIGMAMAGARPVAEIQFDGFVYPAFDQIVSHLGRFRYRTRGNLPVPVVVRFPSGAGIGAHEHHCDSPEAYFVHAPGLVVVCPSTPHDAKGLLTASLNSPDPVIFLAPKVLYRAGREQVPTEAYQIPLGTARVRHEGRDLTIVTYGGMVPQALKAASESERSVEVIDLRTLFPWDRDTVIASVEKTGRLLVVQEAQGAAGVAAEVAAVVAERCLFALEAPIVRLTGFDAPWPQFAIERHALIDHRRILAAIEETYA